MRHLAFRAFCTVLTKAESRQVFTVKLESDKLFTPKATHFQATLIALNVLGCTVTRATILL